MSKKAKKPALGKGLSALLSNPDTDITSNYNDNPSAGAVVGSVAMVPVVSIEANPFQPRTHFEKEALVELTNSIKEHGVIQPITIRKTGNDGFQIISGERRFKASQIAGLKEVPAYVRIANDQAMLEMAIVENIQREDLNAIEIALSFKRLIDECDLTQEQLSEKVGKNRSTCTNYLRLLKLPSQIQVAIRGQEISMGHARALLAIEGEEDQLEAFRTIKDENLSVRATEDLSKKFKKSTGGRKSVSLDYDERKVRDDLSYHFKTRIDIKKTVNGDGRIIISFADQKELQRIIGMLDQ